MATTIDASEIDRRLGLVENWISDYGRMNPPAALPVTLAALEGRLANIEATANNVVERHLVLELKGISGQVDNIKTAIDQAMIPESEAQERKIEQLEGAVKSMIDQCNKIDQCEAAYRVLVDQLNNFPTQINAQVTAAATEIRRQVGQAAR